MFKSRLRETITISGIGPMPPSYLMKKLQNSNITHNDIKWHVSKLSRDSGAFFFETIHPLIISRQTADLEQVVLEFNDDSGASNSFSQELLVSIKLE